MDGYFCIRFIDFMLKGENLLQYTNLFSPNEYKKNDKVILKYFQKILKKLKCIVILAINIENLRKLKYHIFSKKTLSVSIVYSRCGHEYEKIFKDKGSIEILKILSLLNNIEEYQKIYNHVQKGIAQESRLKKIDEIRNYLIEEINQHELISKNHKKVYRI